MSVRILQGGALTQLRTLEAESVQCVVTSPPYFQLRDYGTATWEGGSAECDHAPERPENTAMSVASSTLGGGKGNVHRSHVQTAQCRGCGAVRVDGQIGLEQTPGEFVSKLVAVFDEVRRVLRPDGTCWVNLGDSYAGSGKGPSNSLQRPASCLNDRQLLAGAVPRAWNPIAPGIKPKDLMLIPERFALAMQDAGWWVRSRVAWCKTSAMPESVQDRPTSAWEHVWLFTRSAKYFYDAEAVRQPHKRDWSDESHGQQIRSNGFLTATGDVHRGFKHDANPAGANLRNFWLLGPAPSSLEHYASFPPELPKRCILAGTSEKGACPACGAPWRRLTKPTEEYAALLERQRGTAAQGSARRHQSAVVGSGMTEIDKRATREVRTTGWAPSCSCPPADPVPCVVLDPFLGSGTTALVADRLGRDAVGIELSPEYAAMAQRRLTGDCPMFTDVEVSA